jgi:type VI secretion system VasD/TssJ family lipoprotein
MRPERILSGILLIFLGVCSQTGCFLKKKHSVSIPAGAPVPSVTSPQPQVINVPQQPPPVQRNFARQGVEISFTADTMLNAFDDKAHTLLLVVYQLADVNAFNRLGANVEGIQKLLEADSFDPSVAGVDRFVAQPGEARLVKLNMAENARWVAIVAGYYNLTPHVVSRLIQIPTVVEKQGNNEVTANGHVLINLYLSPNSLQVLDSEAYNL